MATEEYGAGIDEEDEDMAPAASRASTSTMRDEDMAAPEGQVEILPEVKEEEINPELAEWFKVDDKGTVDGPSSSTARYDEDSVTEEEPDSDNEDVKDEPDDWVEVKMDDSGAEVEAYGKAAGKQPEVSVYCD